MSEDNKEAYHIGLIDYLQTYTTKKHFEHLAKTRFGAHPMSNLISCTNAPKYEARFSNFMRFQVFKRTVLNVEDKDGKVVSTNFRDTDATLKN